MEFELGWQRHQLTRRCGENNIRHFCIIQSTNLENQKRLFGHTFWQVQQLDGTAPPN